MSLTLPPSQAQHRTRTDDPFLTMRRAAVREKPGIAVFIR